MEQFLDNINCFQDLLAILCRNIVSIGLNEAFSRDSKLSSI